MNQKQYPVIDLAATGQNILRLRQEKGLSVRDLQAFFGFEEPQAIYKWQRGRCLPTVDNLCALSVLLEEPMNNILVLKGAGQNEEPWAEAHGSFAVRLSGPGAARQGFVPFCASLGLFPSAEGAGPLEAVHLYRLRKAGFFGEASGWMGTEREKESRQKRRLKARWLKGCFFSSV